MEYTLIAAANKAVRVPHFPTTLSEAVALAREHLGLLREADFIRITRYAVVEEALLDGGAVDHEIDMGEWQFANVDSNLCLVALEAFPRDSATVTAAEVVQATRTFLHRLALRNADCIRVVDANETFRTLFKTSLVGDPVVYACRQNHEALAALLTGTGRALRM